MKSLQKILMICLILFPTLVTNAFATHTYSTTQASATPPHSMTMLETANSSVIEANVSGGTVTFEIDRCTTKWGENCYIVGDFNGWKIQDAIRLTTSAKLYPKWQGEANWHGKKVQFKVVVSDGNRVVNWESGSNRSLQVDSNNIRYIGSFSSSQATIETTPPTVPLPPSEPLPPTGDKTLNLTYVQAKWTKVIARYRLGQSNWADVALTSKSSNNWLFTVDTKGQALEICFHNGNGQWDSRNMRNYKLNAGNYRLENEMITPIIEKEVKVELRTDASIKDAWITTDTSGIQLQESGIVGNKKRWTTTMKFNVSEADLFFSWFHESCEFKDGRFYSKGTNALCSQVDRYHLQQEIVQNMGIFFDTSIGYPRPRYIYDGRKSPVMDATQGENIAFLPFDGEATLRIVSNIVPEQLPIVEREAGIIRPREINQLPDGTYEYLVRSKNDYFFPVQQPIPNGWVSITSTPVADAIAPTNPSRVRITSHEYGRFELSWAPSTDNKNVKAYHIFNNKVGKVQYVMAKVASNQTNLTIVDNTFEFLTSVDITVSAVDEDGNESKRIPARFEEAAAYMCTSITDRKLKDFTYAIDASVKPEMKEAIRNAWKQYDGVVGIKSREISQTADALLVFHEASMEGINGYAYSNCHGKSSAITLRTDLEPHFRQGTIVHEIGHILGLEHQPNANAHEEILDSRSMMSYSRTYDTLQPFDLYLLKWRYETKTFQRSYAFQIMQNGNDLSIVFPDDKAYQMRNMMDLEIWKNDIPYYGANDVNHYSTSDQRTFTFYTNEPIVTGDTIKIRVRLAQHQAVERSIVWK